MAEDLGDGVVTITLDDTAADADVSRLADRLESALNRASRDAGLRMERNIKAAVRRITPIKLRVEADLRAFEHSLNTLNNLGSAPVRVTPDVDRAQFEAAIEAALAGLEVNVRVVPDLDDFDDRIRAHQTPTVHVNVDPDRRGLSRFSSAISGIGRSLGRLGGLAGTTLRLGAMGIAAAGAAQSVIGLVGALAPAAGAIAALPAVALGAAAANLTLKLALSGVGDAFKAGLTGDAKAFEKALKGLSPAAQSAAKEVRGLKPQFDKLKSSVQGAFFEPLEGQITKTAKALGGPLKTGMTGISSEFGKAAAEALKFGQSAAAIDGLKSVFAGTKGALSGLSTATQPILKGFLDVAAAVSDAFGSKVGSALGDAAARFGNFLSVAAASGQAVSWVQGAVTVFKQLGALISNIGGILSGVFGAANAVGGGFLNNLIAITGQFKAFVQSAAGQEAIGNIFKTLSQVAAQLGPILSAVVTQLGAIAPALGPLFTTIGPAIAGIINAIGPALQGIIPGIQAVVGGLSDAIGQIADSGALTTLGDAFGQVLQAVAPLLPIVGQIAGVLGNALGGAIAALAPGLGQLLGALGPVIAALVEELAPILPTIGSLLGSLLSALSPIIAALGPALTPIIAAVSTAFSALATAVQPVIEALGPILAQFVTALVPILTQLASAFGQIVVALAPLITQVLSALIPLLPPVLEVFQALLAAIMPLIPVVVQLVQALVPIVSIMLQILAPIAQFAAEILAWVALNVVVPIISGIVSVITGIVGAVTNVLAAIPGFVSGVVGFFTSLWSSITSIVSAGVSAVTGFFSGLWATVTGLVSAGVSTVVSFFAGLPGRAVAAISGIVGAISGVFNSLKSAVTSRVSSMISQAVSTISGFIGKAKSALSGAAGALVSAGADLIRGFISGIKSMAGSLVSAAKGVVKGAVDGAKSLLGINSPSKVFIEIGKFTGQGFVKGLTSTASSIKQTADKLVSLITKAFKGRKTRLDDTLIKSVRSTQKQLEDLAAKRDAIADKIKKANEFAATTTQNALQSFSLQNLSQKGGGVGGLIDGIDAAVSRIRKFNAQINDLTKRGLRKDLLSQVIGLGPEQGAALADQLTRASDAQLDDLNAAQKQLDAAAKKLGKDSADNLFDAGKQASKGFLAGLKGQQKDVEDLMLSLAKGMAKAIRKALGIKSPSRVFRRIGQFTMDGLDGGLSSRLRAVTQTAASAANAITAPFGASPGVNVQSGVSGPSVASGSTSQPVAGGRSLNIAPGAIVINQVSDTDDVARRAINRLIGAGGLL